MAEYSIKDLERLTGIKAHTLRIWEKRHTIIEPKRTPTNIRYYSDDDLKKILNISILNNNGVKISTIADLSEEELNERVMSISQASDKSSNFIDQLTVAMIELDEGKFERVLSIVSLKMGFEKTVTGVLYPFLDKIGILWQTGKINPAQEHFISNLIRQKLIVAIDSLPNHSVPKLPAALLYLPENELHEIGLLFYSYLAKKIGFNIVYLGQSVPYNDLQSVVSIRDPKIIITSISSPIPVSSLKNYLGQLSEDFCNAQIFISGYQINENTVKPFSNIHRIPNAIALKEKLQEQADQY